MRLIQWITLITMALLTGATRAGEPEAPWQDNTVTARVGEIDFRDCPLTGRDRTRFVECAYLDVPEDYGEPGGRRLALFIVRLPARAADAAADPVVAIAGGPGGAASQSFLWLDHQLHELAGRRDIYLIDQRGTGRSGRRDCDLSNRLDIMLDFDPDTARAAGRDCLREFEGDPRRYTTSVAIKDFEAARRALGIDAWNLYGTSYGTRVAQHYMRRHPSAVRTATLDGVVPPGLNLGPDIALHSQAALEALFARCAADADCSRRYPDLDTGVDRLLADLDSAPVRVEYRNPQSGDRIDTVFTRRHLIAVIRLTLYKPQVLSVLPLMLQQAYAGDDFSTLAATAARIEESVPGALAMGMHNAVVCSEDVPYYDSPPLEALAATYMGTLPMKALRALCADWPAGVVDADFKQPLTSAIPTLLLSGEHDPITPPAYAKQAATGLTRARHLVAPGQGHGVAFSGCMPGIVARFVEQAGVEDLQTRCLSRLGAAPVFLNINGPAP